MAVVVAYTLTSIADFQELHAYLLTSFKLGLSFVWHRNFPTKHLFKRSFSDCDLPPVILTLFAVLCISAFSVTSVTHLSWKRASL
uniref:Putative ovule protein n=1 Tax=Solanum chacoense TaxID=4108 RepID=A0A0V0GXP9_SOLCH